MKSITIKTLALLITLLTLPFTATVAINDTHQSFPFGVFDKSDPYGKFDNKGYEAGSKEWMDYRKRLVKTLKKYNVNTVINTAYKDESHARFVLDHLYENNINVIFQPGNSFNKKNIVNNTNPIYKHPSIIAYKLGNEPKDQEKLNKLLNKYALIKKHSHKPIITAMIGEVMGKPDTPTYIKT